MNGMDTCTHIHLTKKCHKSVYAFIPNQEKMTQEPGSAEFPRLTVDPSNSAQVILTDSEPDHPEIAPRLSVAFALS